MLSAFTQIPRWLVYAPLLISFVLSVALYLRTHSMSVALPVFLLVGFFYLKDLSGIWELRYYRIVYETALFLGEVFLVASIFHSANSLRVRFSVFGKPFVCVAAILFLLMVGALTVLAYTSGWEDLYLRMELGTWCMMWMFLISVFSLVAFSRRIVRVIWNYRKTEKREQRTKAPVQSLETVLSDEVAQSDDEKKEEKRYVQVGEDWLIDVDTFAEDYKKRFAVNETAV